MAVDLSCWGKVNMSDKPSKHSLCPCGSQKKYKNCCREKFLLMKKVKEIFENKERERQEFIERYGHIKKPNLIKVGDTSFTTVGNELYKQTRSGDYNFVNVVYDHALIFFGNEFLEKEEAKSIADRHPAIQWLHIYMEHHNKYQGRKDVPAEILQIGAGASWIRLAYDLHTIRDNAVLESVLRQRLLDPARFQSARHELWVAALFIAAGFDIKFEDEKDNTADHPEFIAVHTATSTYIAVEAKSRHRKGVKGFTKGLEVTSGERANVRSLVLDACEKKINYPYYIFIDTNLPPCDSQTWDRWMKEIDQTMADLVSEGYANPCSANAIFFHNDPSHYMLKEQIGAQNDALWIKGWVSINPKSAHPDIDMFETVMRASRQRTAPPEEIPQ